MSVESLLALAAIAMLVCAFAFGFAAGYDHAVKRTPDSCESRPADAWVVPVEVASTFQANQSRNFLRHTPPEHVVRASFVVSQWAEERNLREWRIGHCCSVDYGTRVRREAAPQE